MSHRSGGPKVLGPPPVFRAIGPPCLTTPKLLQVKIAN